MRYHVFGAGGNCGLAAAKCRRLGLQLGLAGALGLPAGLCRSRRLARRDGPAPEIHLIAEGRSGVRSQIA